MEKIKIPVPLNVNYLKEFEDFELPNGILNKCVPNCGATTLAIEDKHKTIICSPRNNLLINKHEQYEKSLLVIGNCTEHEITEYLNKEKMPKILVSYDSFKKVSKCIPDKKGWRVVVDEFQYLLADSSFKSETEYVFLSYLKEFEYVTYLSATPILDEYIKECDWFKDVPYYFMEWQNVEKIKVIRQRSSRPIDAALEIVNSYKKGAFPFLDQGENKVYSKECVIYLNSVTNIVNIIKQTGLVPEEVNIIIGHTDENLKMLHKIGDGFEIGKIPLKGEKHKMFTFCTSTAFAGCDFYSTNASSFVISDNKRVHTIIDISTDLVQIAGRQRLAENPFRKYISLIYNVGCCEKSENEFQAELQRKIELTNNEIEDINKEECLSLKEKKKKDVVRMQSMLNYKETFTMYDSKEDQCVFNKMALLNEQYSYNLQRYNYANGITIRNQLDNNNFDVSVPESYCNYEKQLQQLVKKESFADRMQEYCRYKSEDNMYNMIVPIMESKYPELKMFYEELGGERIKALGYKECKLKNEIMLKNKLKKIAYELKKQFTNKTLDADSIKAIMNKIYLSFEVEKKGKVSDLTNLYGLKVVEHRFTENNGERKRVYEIC